MSLPDKVKKEVAEKFGFKDWKEFKEKVVDKGEINEPMINEFIAFASEFGFNKGVNAAYQNL